MSQYLSLLLSWLAFFRSNPEAAIKLWQTAVAAYEASQVLVNLASDTFGQIMARESAAVLTPDEDEAERQFNEAFCGGWLIPTHWQTETTCEAERQFNEAFSVARGPFGNGKVLRWLLTSEEGKALLAALKSKIPGMGS